MSIEDLTPLQIDELWISVFGEPYRDEEMLSWDNLKFDKSTKSIIHSSETSKESKN